MSTIKMPRMAKKRTGGEHKTPRQNVQFPASWVALARKMAAKTKQPVLWLIIDLLAKEAVKQGESHPPLPWEE